MTEQDKRSEMEQKAMFNLVKGSLDEAYDIWREEILTNPEAAKVYQEGTFGLLEKYQVIGADKIMSQKLTEYLLSQPDIGEVITEVVTEEDADGQKKEGRFSAFIDPLDSTANALRIWERQKLGLPIDDHDLPFGTVIVFAQNRGETFGDVAAAGFVRLDTGYSYIAIKDGGFWIVEPDGKSQQFHLSQIKNQPKSIDEALKSGWTIWVESYYPETREVVANKLFGKDDKGYIRSQGCAANEQAAVAAGKAVAFFGESQKLHEPAATILMVAEAGGVVVDPYTLKSVDGLKLREGFRTQRYPMLFAQNMDLARDFGKRLTPLEISG